MVTILPPLSRVDIAHRIYASVRIESSRDCGQVPYGELLTFASTVPAGLAGPVRAGPGLMQRDSDAARPRPLPFS